MNSGCSASNASGVLGRLAGDEVVPPHVPALGPGDLLTGTAHHQHVLDVVDLADRLVHGRLERGRLAAPVAAVGGDDDLGVRVLDPGRERVRREAAEDDRVGRADPGRGQHRDRGLRDHRHVDGDPVALAHAQLQQGVGGPGDLVLQLRVGDRAAVAGLTLEVDGDTVPVPGLHMPVHAVVRDVQRAVLEPLGERRVRPVQRLARFLGPGQPAGPARPRSRAQSALACSYASAVTLACAARSAGARTCVLP